MDLYGTQQELAKQQASLEGFHDKYSQATTQHAQEEERLNETQIHYKKMLDAVNGERRKCKYDLPRIHTCHYFCLLIGLGSRR